MGVCSACTPTQSVPSEGPNLVSCCLCIIVSTWCSVVAVDVTPKFEHNIFFGPINEQRIIRGVTYQLHYVPVPTVCQHGSVAVVASKRGRSFRHPGLGLRDKFG